MAFLGAASCNYDSLNQPIVSFATNPLATRPRIAHFAATGSCRFLLLYPEAECGVERGDDQGGQSFNEARLMPAMAKACACLR